MHHVGSVRGGVLWYKRTDVTILTLKLLISTCAPQADVWQCRAIQGTWVALVVQDQPWLN